MGRLQFRRFRLAGAAGSQIGDRNPGCGEDKTARRPSRGVGGRIEVIATADRYVLRQIARPLVGAMAIGLMMLLAERMVRLLDTTLGKKNSFAVVFELLAYLVPHYLGTAIPAALFLGLLFGFNKLSKDSDIDAMMATGTGLHRLTRPVILLSVALGALSLFIVGWLQP